MKKIIAVIFLPLVLLSDPVLILSRKGVETDAVSKSIIGGNYVRSQTGSIWIIGWWSKPDMSLIPNSSTHTNITVAQSAELNFATLQKSVAISGFTNFQDALTALKLTPCTEDGTNIAENN